MFVQRFDELKEEVGMIMNQMIDDPLKQLELIDVLQRLGISYRFQKEIKDVLKRTYEKSGKSDDWKKNNLYATSLEFRLLRQHGFNVSQGINFL